MMTDAAPLRALAERLCTVKNGSAGEIRRAAAIPLEPPLLGASRVIVTEGVLSVSAVELQWSPPVFTRAQFDALFGAGWALPRTGAYASHHIAYDVVVAGAPAKVTVFASFARDPKPDIAAKNVLFRIDPPELGSRSTGI